MILRQERVSVILSSLVVSIDTMQHSTSSCHASKPAKRLRLARRYVYALHPFEAVFVKTLWGEASGDDGEQALGQVHVTSADAHSESIRPAAASAAAHLIRPAAPSAVAQGTRPAVH
jgi:hypothetical protein